MLKIVTEFVVEIVIKIDIRCLTMLALCRLFIVVEQGKLTLKQPCSFYD